MKIIKKILLVISAFSFSFSSFAVDTSFPNDKVTMWGDYSGITLDVKLIGGAPYDPLYEAMIPVWEEKTGAFTAKRGPIFANIVLADEINRAPAKVQSALLEAMQERQVTIGEDTHPLPSPFLVMATQNPIEHEGTYPLPEAQVDRFMFKTRVDYPDREEEREILRLMSGEDPPAISAVVQPEEILAARKLLADIYIDERLEDYILALVLATREPAKYDLPELVDWIEFGASPRATIFLARAARAQAFLEGRAFVAPADVKEIARDVLRHRLVLTFQAQAEQVDSESVLDCLLETIPVP